MTRPDKLDLALSDDERKLLWHGVFQWGGTSRCTDELAEAMGFVDREDLYESGTRLLESLESQEPLSRFDWFRVLAAAELCFASDLFGAGRNWSIVSGLSDEESVAALRSVQTKLSRRVRGLIGTSIGTLRTGAQPPDLTLSLRIQTQSLSAETLIELFGEPSHLTRATDPISRRDRRPVGTSRWVREVSQPIDTARATDELERFADLIATQPGYRLDCHADIGVFSAAAVDLHLPAATLARLGGLDISVRISPHGV